MGATARKGKRELLIGSAVVLAVLAAAGGAWLWPRLVAYRRYMAARKVILEASHSRGLSLQEIETLKARIKDLRESPSELVDHHGAALVEQVVAEAVAAKAVSYTDPHIRWKDLVGGVIALLWEADLSPGVARRLAEVVAREPEAFYLLDSIETADGTLFLDAEFGRAVGKFMENASLQDGKRLFLVVYQIYHEDTLGREHPLVRGLRAFRDNFPGDREVRAKALNRDIYHHGAALRKGGEARQTALDFLAGVLRAEGREFCEQALKRVFENAGKQGGKGYACTLTKEEADRLRPEVLRERFPGKDWYEFPIKWLRGQATTRSAPGRL